MKNILNLVLISTVVAVLITACTNKQSKNDYYSAGIGQIDDLFYDNNGELCLSGGVKEKWLVSGVYKYIDGQLYGYYVIPETEYYVNKSFYATENNRRFSACGFANIADIVNKQSVTRIRFPQQFVRWQ